MSRGIIQLLCIVVDVVVVVVVVVDDDDVEPWANPSEGMVLELIDSPTPSTATPRQGENSFSTTKPEHFCRKLKSHSCTHSSVQISLAALVWSFSYFM